MPTKKKRPRPSADQNIPHRGEFISNRIREIIRARGLTPYAVAKEARIAPSVMGRFLDGYRGLTSATLDKVAYALGLEVRETRRGLHKPKARRGRPSAPSQTEPDPT